MYRLGGISKVTALIQSKAWGRRGIQLTETKKSAAVPTTFHLFGREMRMGVSDIWIPKLGSEVSD